MNITVMFERAIERREEIKQILIKEFDFDENVEFTINQRDGYATIIVGGDDDWVFDDEDDLE